MNILLKIAKKQIKQKIFPTKNEIEALEIPKEAIKTALYYLDKHIKPHLKDEKDYPEITKETRRALKVVAERDYEPNKKLYPTFANLITLLFQDYAWKLRFMDFIEELDFDKLKMTEEDKKFAEFGKHSYQFKFLNKNVEK